LLASLQALRHLYAEFQRETPLFLVFIVGLSFRLIADVDFSVTNE
jgi:hypothetical protein